MKGSTGGPSSAAGELAAAAAALAAALPSDPAPGSGTAQSAGVPAGADPAALAKALIQAMLLGVPATAPAGTGTAALPALVNQARAARAEIAARQAAVTALEPVSHGEFRLIDRSWLRCFSYLRGRKLTFGSVAGWSEMGECSFGVRRWTARIIALMLSLLTLSVFLSWLSCATVNASASPGYFSLPGYAGQCPLLEIGSTDKACVKVLQGLLRSLLNQSALRADGNYNTQTYRDVVAFQEIAGLYPADGKVGPETARALGVAWRNLQSNHKRTASRSGARPGVTSSNLPGADTNGSSRIISLQDIVVIGIFVLLVTATIVFGVRLKRMSFNGSISGGSIGFNVELYEGVKGRTIEALDNAIDALSRAAHEAGAVAEAYRRVADILNVIYLQRNARIWRIIRVSRRYSELAGRVERKMIEGRVEKDE